nr:hypothetical protein [Candidatus Sigynarchaeum springense]
MSSDSPALIISFRLRDRREREILLEKAKKTSSNVTEFLRGCIFGKTQINSPANVYDSKALIDDMAFMFKFFQKNASNLKITDEERERFSEILKKVKEMAANEP